MWKTSWRSLHLAIDRCFPLVKKKKKKNLNVLGKMEEENNQLQLVTPKLENQQASFEDSMTLAKFSRRASSFTPRPYKVNVDHGKSSTSFKRKVPSTDSAKAKSSALKRAEEVQANLDPEFPSFVKSMVASHVASGHWLGLPAQFCKLYLPQNDPTITLVDENGDEYPTRLIYDKTGLSAGWRKFALDHKLLEGDALVFQLIESTKLKVYITRAYSSAEVDVALGLLDLDSRAKKSDPGMRIKIPKRYIKKSRRSLPLCVIQGNNWNSSPPRPDPNVVVPTGQTGNDSEEVDSEVLQGSVVEFKEIGSLDSFTIKVNGVGIDSEISEYVRTKYYELCCSQKSFLHEHILKGMNSKLVAGIISETVSIADAIIVSNPTTPRDDFATWEKSLIAFEQLGMNVGFLVSRLQRLVSIAFESEQAMEAKRYGEAIIRHDSIEAEIRYTEAKLVELREASRRFEAEIESLKEKVEDHELNFQAEARAPW